MILEIKSSPSPHMKCLLTLSGNNPEMASHSSMEEICLYSTAMSNLNLSGREDGKFKNSSKSQNLLKSSELLSHGNRFSGCLSVGVRV